ncbi:MAG TPA: invasion associated locus B family protein [Hypericibacter adhaerens]|uniref:invasion associated locus B family protein n=1 Tax=Hypericibacter adhaerens TaxID=2602016 RepID=UPI002C5EBD8B|nr:invasion associated locus B family protein [Hypericibacter adhaerens]HWA42608.1 invasion associated locus B family protein [Hypericibacter adhaerens]
MIQRPWHRLTATSLLLAASTLVAASTTEIPANAGAPEATQIAQAAEAPADSGAGLLPGGATSLTETYGDWVVACAQPQGIKRCTLSQQQTDKASKQRLLAVELMAMAGDKAEGMLILPFGLLLDPGIALQIDEAAPGPARHFRTCLPAGCFVPLALDAKMIDALRKGKLLKVNATAAADGKPIAFGISLAGFGGAFARTVKLAQQPAAATD